jgi:hypothetical protein
MQRLAALFLCSVLAVASVSAQQPGYPFPQPPVGPPPMPPPPPQETPPPPPPPVVQYYVEENGRPAGPLSLDQVQQRVLQGQLKPTTVVWKTGLAQWVEAKSMDELADAFKEAAPPEIPLDARIEKFMVGSWVIEEPGLMGVVTRTTIRYDADGRFVGYSTNIMGDKNLGSSQLRGKWKVVAISEREFDLTVIASGGQGDSYTFQIIDHNTLQNKDDGTFARRVK